MKLAVDVDYREPGAVVAGVGFVQWGDAVPCWRGCVEVPTVAAYRPGHFFERELPCIQALLAVAPGPVELIVVDGHAWLGPGRPGLGAHLFEAVGVAVVGVAKRPFVGRHATEVLHGGSARPLYVTAAGFDGDAAAAVASMHGPHRLPTLLKQVDALCRAC